MFHIETMVILRYSPTTPCSHTPYRINTYKKVPLWFFKTQGGCVYMYNTPSARTSLEEYYQVNMQTTTVCCFLQRDIFHCQGGFVTDFVHTPMSEFNTCFWMFQRTRAEDLLTKDLDTYSDGDTFLRGGCVILLTPKQDISILETMLLDNQNTYMSF
jgi:hypothetical protein